jgi:hypothetical protein
MEPVLVFPDALKQDLLRRQKEMNATHTLSSDTFASSKQHAKSLLGGARSSISRAAFLRKHGLTKQFNNAPVMRAGKRDDA